MDPHMSEYVFAQYSKEHLLKVKQIPIHVSAKETYNWG
jgi:hypothetical protein